jgi:hypothetical protein
MTKEEVETIGNLLRLVEGRRKMPGSCFQRAIKILTQHERDIARVLRDQSGKKQMRQRPKAR